MFIKAVCGIWALPVIGAVQRLIDDVIIIVIIIKSLLYWKPFSHMATLQGAQSSGKI